MQLLLKTIIKYFKYNEKIKVISSIFFNPELAHYQAGTYTKVKPNTE